MLVGFYRLRATARQLKIDSMRLRLHAVVLALASCAAPAPQEEPVLRDVVDAAVRPFLEKGTYMGVAVGILHDGRRHVFGYGRISARESRPPDGATVFEIGSITKAFTGMLLLESGLPLEDPIRKHLPPDVKAPSRNGKEITLLDLATHRSGLPTLPDSFAPKDASNPYADFLVDELYHALETCKLSRDPGKSYEYSNLGMGLLGHILALKAGRSYEELVIEKICRPLGMNDTCMTLSADQKRRLAPGHLPSSGKIVSNWDIPGLAGAGALRSTADDMLRFLEANLGDRYEGAQVRRAYVGEGLGIGLGWHLMPVAPKGPMMVWHNGGTGGYYSFAGLVKASKTAVIVLTNTAADVDALGVSLLKLLQSVK